MKSELRPIGVGSSSTKCTVMSLGMCGHMMAQIIPGNRRSYEVDSLDPHHVQTRIKAFFLWSSDNEGDARNRVISAAAEQQCSARCPRILPELVLEFEYHVGRSFEFI